MSDGSSAPARNEAGCDVFVSYAREDHAVAARLVDYLDANNIKVYWDQRLQGGEVWTKELETQLSRANSIAVLWSKHSVESDWVKEEARYGASRQVLVAARLDDSEPPFGYGHFHADDLRGWTSDTPPSGIVPVLNRIRQLIADAGASRRSDGDDKLKLAQKFTQTEHISVSDHERDRNAVLDKIGDLGPDLRNFVEGGYREMEAAQHVARFVPDDHAPETHYASAADHFKNALEFLKDEKKRKARDNRSIEYFLSMERANCLAFSEPVKGKAHAEAIAIYERLAVDPRYRDDVPVHFRLGCALARSANDELTIQKAIRSLHKARQLAHRAELDAAASDRLLTEGNWVQFEIAKQMGLCCYRRSQLYGETSLRGKSSLEEAIKYTLEAVVREQPENGYSELMAFTVIKALGNLVFLLATKLRNGDGDATTRADIARYIQVLKSDLHWPVVVNQISIIDSIAYAAATIFDWKLAAQEAKRNLEYYARLGGSDALTPEDRENQARAKEILYFAELFQSGRAKLVEG